MLAQTHQVTDYLMSRLIDTGNELFSNDYSYITCATC